MGKSVDSHLQRWFYHCGYFVHRFRFLCLLTPIALTACLSYGLVYLDVQTVNDTTYVFTPIVARNREERRVFDQLWPLVTDRFIPGKSFQSRHEINIIATSKDEENILRYPILDEIYNLNAYIQENISITTLDGRYLLSYENLCLNWEGECFDNGHVNMFRQRDELTQYINLTYPRGGKSDTPVYFGVLFGGVKSKNGQIYSAKTCRLVYNLLQNNSDSTSLMDHYSRMFQQRLEYFLLHEYRSDLIEIAFYHGDSMSDGLDQNAQQFLPNFATSIFFLGAFAVMCSFVLLPKGLIGRRRWGGIDWVRSKPLLVIAGMICAGMAIASSFGLLLLCGFDYNVIASVMPFLVISIGVDDMFIMSSAWHRTNPLDPVEERLANTLSEAAVSITITSLTDALSFAIGCVSVLPGVWMFCAYAAVAVVFAYIYQITFFAAVLAFLGNAEAKGRHCLFYVKVTSPDKSGLVKSIFFTGMIHTPSAHSICRKAVNLRHPHEVSEEEETLVCKLFRNYYGPFILHPISKLFVLFTVVVYIGFAVWGCFQIQEGLNPVNLIVEDHYLNKFFKAIFPFGEEGLQLHVAVTKPPNLTQAEEFDKLLDLVHEFESTTHSMGRDATIFWLYEYINYLNDFSATFESNAEEWEKGVYYWYRNTGAQSQWEMDMVWSNTTPKRLTAYRFRIGLKNYETPNDHRQTAVEMRAIADKHSELGVTVYHEYFPYADQYLIILPSTLRNIGIAIGCMVLVSLLLIPSIHCALMITIAIVSIDLGVFGYMAWWSVNLDAISMITIIMSIGFAVDLSAHISYAYVRADCGSAHDRAIRALETLGWPVFQGAFSTLLGMAVLATVESYLIMTFFKTVFLVIVFGLMHSVVILPVALTVFMPDRMCCGSHRQSSGKVGDCQFQIGVSVKSATPPLPPIESDRRTVIDASSKVSSKKRKYLKKTAERRGVVDTGTPAITVAPKTKPRKTKKLTSDTVLHI